MQKFLLLTGAFLLFSFFEINAQIQITLNDMPTSDTAFSVYYRNWKTKNFEGLSHGANGENVIWDFSKLTSDKADSSKFVDPTTFNPELAAVFTGSNIAEVTGKNISYYSMTESRGKQSVKLLGTYDTIATKYSTSLTTIDLPLDYLKQSSAIGVFTVALSNTSRVQEIISKKDTVIGWGIINTPYKSYDVLKVSSFITITRNYQEYNLDTWTTNKKENDTIRTYSWWANGIGKEVFKINYLGATGDIISDASWFSGRKALLITGNAKALSSTLIDVAPNPSNGNIVLSISDPSAKGYKLSVLDLVGKEKYNGIIADNMNRFDFSFLPDGIYLLRITAPDGRSLLKKVNFNK